MSLKTPPHPPKPKLIVLTGAGISAESGLKTFRDSDGLWEEHDVLTVASLRGWHENPELILNFYNQRRAQLDTVEPNQGHLALAELEDEFEVVIITQNVDDLHERAGSSRILHLHGQLRKMRSSVDESIVLDWESDLKMGQLCPKGSQLRPHVVWFGEPVPAIEDAQFEMQETDAVMVIGTSMQVYPAAGLVDYVDPHVPIWYVDPHPAPMDLPNLEVIAHPATIGVPKAIEHIRKRFLSS